MTAPFAAGASLIVISAIAVSVSAMTESRKRVRDTEAVLELISHAKSDIDCFLTPVDVIFSDFRCDALESCGFMNVLRQSGIEKAVSSRTASFSENTKDILLRFSSSLGRGYREDELRLCDWAYDGVSKELEKEIAGIRRNSGAIRFAPLIAALFFILCFL